jgi:hypothetical protein
MQLQQRLLSTLTKIGSGSASLQSIRFKLRLTFEKRNGTSSTQIVDLERPLFTEASLADQQLCKRRHDGKDLAWSAAEAMDHDSATSEVTLREYRHLANVAVGESCEVRTALADTACTLVAATAAADGACYRAAGTGSCTYKASSTGACTAAPPETGVDGETRCRLMRNGTVGFCERQHGEGRCTHVPAPVERDDYHTTYLGVCRWNNTASGRDVCTALRRLAVPHDLGRPGMWQRGCNAQADGRAKCAGLAPTARDLNNRDFFRWLLSPYFGVVVAAEGEAAQAGIEGCILVPELYAPMIALKSKAPEADSGLAWGRSAADTQAAADAIYRKWAIAPKEDTRLSPAAPYTCTDEEELPTSRARQCTAGARVSDPEEFAHTNADGCLCMVATGDGEGAVGKVWSVQKTAKSVAAGAAQEATMRAGRNNGITLLTLSEREREGVAEAMASFGLIALYTSIVLGIAKSLKFQRFEKVQNLIYEDRAAVRYIYRLCDDIYAARKFGALDERYFVLEEKLWRQVEALFRDTAKLVAIAAREQQHAQAALGHLRAKREAAQAEAQAARHREHGGIRRRALREGGEADRGD